MTNRTISEGVEHFCGAYVAGAVKRGQWADRPYVPVLRFASSGKAQTQQIPARAFATREEAVSFAAKHLDAWRAKTAERLSDPRNRALRRQCGVGE